MVAVAGALVLGESMTPIKAFAVIAIALGVVVMSLKGSADLGRLPGKALGYALASSIFIAAYSLVDGVGARVALTASGFVLWMFVLDGLVMLAYGFATRGKSALARWFRPGAKAYRRCALARRLLDRGLGLHPGADRAGGGATRNQRAVRHVDRGLYAA
jgi:drug/metabolite transporter (DMT)-like permease